VYPLFQAPFVSAFPLSHQLSRNPFFFALLLALLLAFRVQAGISLDEYTRKYKEAFFEDLDTLNIDRADFYPEATKHIDDMVALIQKLLEKGYAYYGEDGCIYYSISKFKDYGKLSGKRPDKLIAGARISHDEYDKELWADFALWKAWTPEDGDIYWDTPLGRGRPGWHIECSAMSMKYLGETFDIHTGGEDNLFPHHENEIAQSEAATGKPFVRYWLHCAHLIVEGKKMSKSLGNYYTLRDLLEKSYKPMAIRYLLLSTHYRQKLNFTFEGIKAAESAIDRLREFRDMLEEYAAKNIPGTDPKVTEALEDGLEGFERAMDDDLNISPALAREEYPSICHHLQASMLSITRSLPRVPYRIHRDLFLHPL